MAEASVLYYISLKIVPTLQRMGKILGRPYMRVMTYKAPVFLTLKYLGNYHQ
jgi:hypothetical protein